MIKLVIFDMAGTAVNENNLVYKTLQQSLNDFDYLINLDQVLALGAGMEKRDAIEKLMKTIDKKVDQQSVDQVFQHFNLLLNVKYETAPMHLFPGTKDAMDYLRANGILIAFNTGYKRETALNILDRIDVKIGVHIDMLATADQVANARPAPDMIDLISNKMQIPVSHILKVGDSKIDVEEGRNAGVAYSLGVSTGAHSVDQLMEALPDKILSDMSELIEFIEEVNAIEV